MSDLKNGKMQALSDDDLDQVSGGFTETKSFKPKKVGSL